MKPGKIGHWLARYNARECTFDRFARETRADWIRLAGTLIDRWRGHGLSVDDLVQEMLLNVFLMVPKHDPSKSPLASYVVFNACVQAKRAIVRARPVSRDRKLPTHLPMDGHSRTGDRHGAMDEDRLHLHFTNAEIVGTDWILETIHACESVLLARKLVHPQLSPVLNAIAQSGGSVERIIATLEANSKFRRENRIGSPDDTRRLVHDVCAYVANIH